MTSQNARCVGQCQHLGSRLFCLSPLQVKVAPPSQVRASSPVALPQAADEGASARTVSPVSAAPVGARASSPVNVSGYTAEFVPIASASNTSVLKSWTRSPAALAGIMAVLAIAVAVVLGMVGSGSSSPALSSHAAPAVVAAETVVGEQDVLVDEEGGGAGRKYEVLEELTAQIRELEGELLVEEEEGANGFFDPSF